MLKKEREKRKKNIMKENFFDVLSWIFVLKYKNGNKNWNDDIFTFINSYIYVN